MIAPHFDPYVPRFRADETVLYWHAGRKVGLFI